MLSNSGGIISLRSQWQGRFEGESPPGGTDPFDCIFRLVLSPAHENLGGSCCEGYWWNGYCTDGSGGRSLEANTTDNPDKIVVTPLVDGFSLEWVFPASEISRLEPGAYDCSITATAEDDTLEIAYFSTVAR